MGRIETLDRPLGALPVLRTGFGAIRESQVREALARWEDDGGRVSEPPQTRGPGSLAGIVWNRAQSATAW